MQLKQDVPISGVIIYYSFNTISRVTLATKDSRLKSFGTSAGSKNTGVIRFEGGNIGDSFFGFTS